MSIIIYKIYDDLDCYVGSTRSDLDTRMLSHKCPSNPCKSKIILKRNNYKFEIIEEVNEDNRYDRELFYINQMSTLKQQKPPLKLEDRKQNKLDMDKKYRLEHLDKDRNRGISNIVCECGITYSSKHQARHMNTKKHKMKTDPEVIEQQRLLQKEIQERNKEYKHKWYLENKEKATEKGKIYREENKEKLNEKFTCECGGRYTKQHLALHNKTQKHLKFMNNQE